MLRRWLTEERETYLLGLVRVVFGVLLAIHVWRHAVMLEVGYFGELFHMPLIPESWVMPRAAYVAWLWLSAAACLLIVLGIAARPALAFAALSGLYVMVSDRLHYHNNRYVLLLMCFLLAFTPCDRSFRIRGNVRDPELRRGPIWAQRLMQLQLSLVYLASGGGKLLDPDWRSGTVIMLRVGRNLDRALAQGQELPELLLSILRSPLTFSVACKLAILLELSLAILLWVPRLRAFALWLGVVFHLGIELTSKVEIFSWLVLTVYVLFVVPELRERVFRYDPTSRNARMVAGAVRWLDWLLRFRIEPMAAPAQVDFEVVDRDGTRAVGIRGVALIARALPALFLLWPALWLASAAAGRPRGALRTG